MSAASPSIVAAGPQGEKEGFQVKKQPEIKQIAPKKPVRIKLKRSEDGQYTWEITGDSATEIIKADQQLKKYLEAK